MGETGTLKKKTGQGTVEGDMQRDMCEKHEIS